jgi:hypothetical protein
MRVVGWRFVAVSGRLNAGWWSKTSKSNCHFSKKLTFRFVGFRHLMTFNRAERFASMAFCLGERRIFNVFTLHGVRRAFREGRYSTQRYPTKTG